MSIRKKLLVVFVGIVLVQKITISFVYYGISSNIAMNTEINEKLYRLYSLYEKTDALLNEKQQVGIGYHINNSLHAILKRFKTNGSISIEEQMNMRMILADYESIGNSFALVTIYMPGDSVFSASLTSFSAAHMEGIYTDGERPFNKNPKRFMKKP